MIRTIYFYKYFGDIIENLDFDDNVSTPITDNDFLVISLCRLCAKKWTTQGEILSAIDKAGDWDICQECEAQNVPDWYTSSTFKADTLN